MEKSDLDLLTQELNGVKQKWNEIGEELGYPSSTLDKIRRENTYSGDCLLELFKYGLEEHPGSTTWRNIVDALRSLGVGKSELADQLEAKYCPSEFINNNILLYFIEYIVVQHSKDEVERTHRDSVSDDQFERHPRLRQCTRSTPHKV